MISLSRRSTVEELRRSAELYYLERDARSNAQVRMPAEHAHYTVAASLRAARSANGQMLLLTLFNVLMRSGRRFAAPAIDIPDVPLVVPTARLRAKTLRAAVQELADRIDPHHGLHDGSLDYGICLSIGISRKPGPVRTIGVGVTDVAVVLRSEGFESTRKPNPLAACVAAAGGVAELYKELVLQRAGVTAQLPVPALRRTNIGEGTLIGAGGIGNAFAWVAQWLPLMGKLRIVDSDVLEISNLNRYLMAFLDDLESSKPGLLAAAIQASGKVCAVAREGRYEQLRDAGAVDVAHDDLVLTATDSGISRIEVQSDLPRLVCNAGTNAWSFEASRHDFLDGACVACLYPPRTGVNYREPVPCDGRRQTEVRPNDSYSFVTGLAGFFLAFQAQATGTAGMPSSSHVFGSALNLDSVLSGRREKDPECTLFCSDPDVQAHYVNKHGIRVPATGRATSRREEQSFAGNLAAKIVT